MLIVGGLILAWATERGWPIRPRYAIFEANVLAIVLVLVTWAVFWRWNPAFTYLNVSRGWLGRAAIRDPGGHHGRRHRRQPHPMGHRDRPRPVRRRRRDRSHPGAVAVAAVPGSPTLTGLVLAAQVAELSRTQQALRTVELAEREARLEHARS